MFGLRGSALGMVEGLSTWRWLSQQGGQGGERGWLGLRLLRGGDGAAMGLDAVGCVANGRWQQPRGSSWAAWAVDAMAELGGRSGVLPS